MSFLQSIMGGPPTGAQVQTITGNSAVQFFGDKDTVFVDVRSLGEMQMSGTIKGAIRAPLPEFMRHAKPDGSGTLPAANSDKRIILVCASGARSGAAASSSFPWAIPMSPISGAASAPGSGRGGHGALISQ